MMRIASFFAISYLLTITAWAQLGLEGQSAKNPDLVRALDAASAAFANAQRAAANNQMVPLRDALNLANTRWAECYGKYREWPTQDTAWRANFDAINAALLNAVNQLTPGNNIPAAKVQIDSAASTLSTLRTRNGVLDVVGSTDKLNTSLEALQTTIAGISGRPLTPADITALKTAFGTFRDSHAVYVQAVVDSNAFGLDNGELESWRKLVALQNIGIDTIFNVLSDPETAQLVTQWQSLREEVIAMLTEFRDRTATADAAQATAKMQVQPDNGQPQKDNGDPTVGAGAGDRPRLLPRLRR